MNYYRIAINGYGGEAVFGKATKQQHAFWNDEEQLVGAGFEEGESALTTYMSDVEEWDKTVPKMARFQSEWHEMDDYLHTNGSALDSAYIQIDRASSPEWDAMLGETVYNDSLLNFKNTYNECIDQTEFNLDDVTSEKDHYVFYGMSCEKGTFFAGVVGVEGELDLSKLTFVATELPNNDNLINNVLYDGEEIENWGGDTRGKAMYMEIWDW